MKRSDGLFAQLVLLVNVLNADDTHRDFAGSMKDFIILQEVRHGAQ